MIVENETYLVGFPSGAGGNFIALLIWCLIHNDYSTIIDFPFGHSHLFPNLDKNNIAKIYYPASPTTDLYADELIEPGVCLIIDHSLPDLTRLIKKFPNVKNIIITISPNMYHRVAANFYFKNIAQKDPLSEIEKYWMGVPGVTPDFFKYDLSNIPHFELNEKFNNVASSYHWHVGLFKDGATTYPQNNAVSIRYYDLIHNKERVLETLSQITQRSISPYIHTVYENYLAAQRKLLPWLDDSGYIS